MGKHLGKHLGKLLHQIAPNCTTLHFKLHSPKPSKSPVSTAISKISNFHHGGAGGNAIPQREMRCTLGFAALINIYLNTWGNIWNLFDDIAV